MVHISNSLTSFLNFLTLFISIPIIGIALWLHYQTASDCEQTLLWPIIITGLFLMVVALLGLVESCCNASCFLWTYLFVMFVMIVGLFCITVFSIVVANKGVGEAVSGKGYKEYKLGDYSNWLQNRVGDFQSWRRIKSCLIDARVCGGLQLLVFQNSNDLYSPALSSIQSGCCKPPLSCGYKQVNATTWKVPKSGPNSNDADCKTWSNDQNILCFDCSSCKAGVLANIKVQWRKIAIFNVCLLVFLIATYSIGCCALRNSCKDDQYLRYN
ncbi:tetraspanin-8-like [Phalaenopsis equestris]|uniref:tetraspanin-8-like n=1 Tax=Phalaenopsis equestris TaxID=78828 RepID=UPI0009E5526C|nr:tetraspanin-8-like [Phalaenopsis equestris]